MPSWRTTAPRRTCSTRGAASSGSPVNEPRYGEIAAVVEKITPFLSSPVTPDSAEKIARIMLQVTDLLLTCDTHATGTVCVFPTTGAIPTASPATHSSTLRLILRGRYDMR